MRCGAIAGCWRWFTDTYSLHLHFGWSHASLLCVCVCDFVSGRKNKANEPSHFWGYCAELLVRRVMQITLTKHVLFHIIHLVNRLVLCVVRRCFHNFSAREFFVFLTHHIYHTTSTMCGNVAVATEAATTLQIKFIGWPIDWVCKYLPTVLCMEHGMDVTVSLAEEKKCFDPFLFNFFSFVRSFVVLSMAHMSVCIHAHMRSCHVFEILFGEI